MKFARRAAAEPGLALTAKTGKPANLSATASIITASPKRADSLCRPEAPGLTARQQETASTF